jgi:hypothetical protein
MVQIIGKKRRKNVGFTHPAPLAFLGFPDERHDAQREGD